MRAAAIITDGLEPISSKAERPSPAVQKTGHERAQPETCGNVISYRRDDSRPDGSIELRHHDDVNWAHTDPFLGGRITYSNNTGNTDNVFYLFYWKYFNFFLLFIGLRPHYKKGQEAEHACRFINALCPFWCWPAINSPLPLIYVYFNSFLYIFTFVLYLCA